MADKRGNKSNIKMGKQTNSIGNRQIIRLFIWISIYRLANAWMIRTQFDPDEYWQTLEPAYCLVFGSSNNNGNIASNATNNGGNHLDDQRMHGCALTWEWKRRWTPPSGSDDTTIQPELFVSVREKIIVTSRAMIEQALYGPVRSYVSILPTYWYYLACRSVFRWAGIGIEHDNNEGYEHHNASRDGLLTQYYTRLIGYLKQFIRQHATYIISKGPAFLNAMLVAAPTDLSVWLIASRMSDILHPKNKSQNGLWRWQSSWPFWALTCSITSWFHGYALIRTYANSFETMCLVVGIALLGPELFGHPYSEHKPQNNHRHRYYRPRAKLAFVLGGLSACVRFTALAAWIPVGLIIAFRSGESITRDGANKYSYVKVLQTLIGLCGICGLIGVMLGCCIDRWFYGFWAMPVLGNIHFNILLGHGSLYGTHPFLWYAYAGIPAICGIVLPFFLWEVAMLSKVASTNIMSPKQDNRRESDCNDTNDNPLFSLIGIITPYILLHSFSEHKEFRFLLPILPLVCIMAGHAIAGWSCVTDGYGACYSRKYSDTLLKSFMGKKTLASLPKLILVALVLLNYPHLLYLGFIHQRGPIAVNQYLAAEINREARPGNPNNNSQNSQQYTIHFLMGCHSAPLYSHLHIPNARVDAWHLDCSPSCRSDPEVVCESDAFSNDPAGFASAVYGVSGDDSCMEVDGVRELPSFLAVMQDDAAAMGDAMTEKLRMSHVGSFRHTVKSVSWHRQTPVSNDNQYPSHYDVVTLLSLIDVHFDHMEVFRRSSRLN